MSLLTILDAPDIKPRIMEMQARNQHFLVCFLAGKSSFTMTFLMLIISLNVQSLQSGPIMRNNTMRASSRPSLLVARAAAKLPTGVNNSQPWFPCSGPKVSRTCERMIPSCSRKTQVQILQEKHKVQFL
jgi:hypothetical protein